MCCMLTEAATPAGNGRAQCAAVAGRSRGGPWAWSRMQTPGLQRRPRRSRAACGTRPLMACRQMRQSARPPTWRLVQVLHVAPQVGVLVDEGLVGLEVHLVPAGDRHGGSLARQHEALMPFADCTGHAATPARSLRGRTVLCSLPRLLCSPPGSLLWLPTHHIHLVETDERHEQANVGFRQHIPCKGGGCGRKRWGCARGTPSRAAAGLLQLC